MYDTEHIGPLFVHRLVPTQQQQFNGLLRGVSVYDNGELIFNSRSIKETIDIRHIDIIGNVGADQITTYAWDSPIASRVVGGDGDDLIHATAKGAALPEVGVAGVRVVGYRIFPDGSGTSRDDNMRYVLLHDPVSGQPLAIVDEHTSYGVRSAASGVVGAKYLARPDSGVVGLVGAGKLMRSALLALATLFPPPPAT